MLTEERDNKFVKIRNLVVGVKWTGLIFSFVILFHLEQWTA